MPTATPARWAWMVRDVSAHLTPHRERVLPPRRFGRSRVVIAPQLRGLWLHPGPSATKGFR